MKGALKGSCEMFAWTPNIDTHLLRDHQLYSLHPVSLEILRAHSQRKLHHPLTGQVPYLRNQKTFQPLGNVMLPIIKIIIYSNFLWQFSSLIVWHYSQQLFSALLFRWLQKSSRYLQGPKEWTEEGKMK